MTHYGSDAASRYRALIVQAMRDLARQWQTLLRRGQAKTRDGLLIYPVRASRRNVPRAVGIVGNPRGLLVGRIDDDGTLIVLTFVGERMSDASILREARGRTADDETQR